MRRLSALLGGLLLSAIAQAGQADLTWTPAPGIKRQELAVGSCNGAAYGLDVADETGRVEYTSLAADTNSATVGRLEQGETFCFRVRSIAASGVPSTWLFLGSKRIPLDTIVQPPTLPMPPPPTDGSVT